MVEPARAWVTHAPGDYILYFTPSRSGEHAVVRARFDSEAAMRRARHGLEGAEVDADELRAYCTIPGEAEWVLAHVEEAGAIITGVERGSIKFVGAGTGMASGDGRSGQRARTASAVVSLAGHAPRCYRFTKQCDVCGEFRGEVLVMPRGGMMLDTRELKCRCDSIPCRYCMDGRVRRPVSEHFDPERRSGCVPWFGYLVPCGNCQAAGRGPRVVMSAPQPGRGGNGR